MNPLHFLFPRPPPPNAEQVEAHANALKNCSRAELEQRLLDYRQKCAEMLVIGIEFKMRAHVCYYHDGNHELWARYEKDAEEAFKKFVTSYTIQ